MATFLTGVITNKGREVIAKGIANVAGYPIVRAFKFRYGEGGWENLGGGRVPKTPNPALTNVEATNTPGDIYVEKQLTSLDFQFLAPSTIQIRCRLEPTEGNDDGLGDAPTFFEVGVFDDNDNMLFYATFDEQTKAPNKILTALIQVYF